MRKIKRAKRTLTIDQKANWIIGKLKEHVRYFKAVNGHIGVGFTMRDIAAHSGYAASSKLMNDLYEMCDLGYLILDQEGIKKTGVADTRNKFWLPDSYAERLTTQKMFREAV
jgi:hypothetical protein